VKKYCITRDTYEKAGALERGGMIVIRKRPSAWESFGHTVDKRARRRFIKQGGGGKTGEKGSKSVWGGGELNARRTRMAEQVLRNTRRKGKRAKNGSAQTNCNKIRRHKKKEVISSRGNRGK